MQSERKGSPIVEVVEEKISARILDILILQDKTLFCTFEDNFKQNGVFWRQHLPAGRV